MVVLAQLAEHRIVVPSVVGSSPTFHPKYNEPLRQKCCNGFFFAAFFMGNGLVVSVPMANFAPWLPK